MAIEIFNRQELKFIITVEQRACIVRSAMSYMRPDKHNVDNRPYWLYNLYIDTPDSALIRHSLSKPVYKEKLRIRSYENFTSEALVFLEIKKRYKRITNKRRTKMTYHDALKFVRTGTVPQLCSYMNTQVVRELVSILGKEQYQPQTFITYARLAFSSIDPASDLRITFDSHITARGYKESPETQLLDDGYCVMEIKSTRNIPLWLVDLLDEHGIRKQHFSKYGQEYLRYLRQELAIPKGVTYA